MNWILVSLVGRKESVSDVIDLDGCAINWVTMMEGSESSGINVVDWSHHRHPVLDCNLIKWRNIDGTRALMIT